MATVNFDINDALKHYMSDPSSIQTPEADGALFDCENEPEALTNAVINPVLNPIVEAVADHPDAIMRASHMDNLQFLLKYALSCCPPQSEEEMLTTTLDIHRPSRPMPLARSLTSS